MADDDVEEFVYESDHNGVDDSPEVAPRRRGAGRLFEVVAQFDTLQLAITAMETYSNPYSARVKGRNNRGKTSSYYWQCSYNTCGCKKEWRISTNLYTSDVVEEESVGEHSCHELLRRGLSFAHIAIIQESTDNGIKKPKNLVHAISKRSKALLLAGTIHSKLDNCNFS
jgi:hypothetical protein